MATLFGIDCAADRPLIGTEPCFVEPGPLLGHIVFTNRPAFDVATTTPNKAFFNSLVQQGSAYFIADAFGSPVEVADPTMETSDITQRSVVVNRALPMVTTTLKKPYEYHKEFYKLSSQDQYSVALVYQNVVKVNVSKDKLTWGGFNVGMYEVLTYEEATGSTKAQTRVMYQITDLDGYNTRGMYLYNLDFNPNTDINNVTDVFMTGRADVSEQKVFVKTVWNGNQAYNVAGFAAANFRLYVNGVVDEINGTVTRNAQMEWEITPTATIATSDTIEVELFDANATPPVNVAKVGTNNPKFYLGRTPEITPVA